jgi:hypothetical protein
VAEKLSNEGKYTDALRVLFDAMYREQRIGLSTDAAHEITKIEQYLIHEDQSPLMQFFRDPDFPIQEKREYISELRALAKRQVQDNEKILFQGKYHGPLVQLMTSRKLTLGEKFDVLIEIEHAIQTEYTPEVQREQTLEKIVQLQTLAAQKLGEKHFVEAFILLTEAQKKQDDILFYRLNDPLDNQITQSITFFIQSDESSLMKLFKNPKISSTEKKELLSELKMFAKHSPTVTDKVLLRRKEYDGTLVQLMSNPKVSWLIKLDVLWHIEKTVEKEDSFFRRILKKLL